MYTMFCRVKFGVLAPVVPKLVGLLGCDAGSSCSS
jgi:hypothetical protein